MQAFVPNKPCIYEACFVYKGHGHAETRTRALSSSQEKSFAAQEFLDNCVLLLLWQKRDGEPNMGISYLFPYTI